MNTATISALQSFPDQLELFFNTVPKKFRHWSPDSWIGIPSESLNAIEQICHVRDVEIEGYHIRFQRMLTEENPTLDSLNSYSFIQMKNYAQSEPKLVFKEFREARNVTLKLIKKMTKAQIKNTGYFEGYGKLTVGGLIHYLCSHDQQHLSGLQWLLGKIESNVYR